jgi:hypothetical protein
MREWSVAAQHALLAHLASMIKAEGVVRSRVEHLVED